MKREAIVPAGMRAFYDDLGYAPAVRHGSTIYVSGQLGRDAQLRVVVDKEAQFVQVFENIATVLTTTTPIDRRHVRLLWHFYFAPGIEPLADDIIDGVDAAHKLSIMSAIASGVCHLPSGTTARIFCSAQSS